MTSETIEHKLFSEHVIDNRRLSMVDALKYLLTQEEFKTLDVAVGYFYITGLLLLKNEFTDFTDNRNGHFRILMGNETNGGTVNVLDGSYYKNYVDLIAAKSKNDTDRISDKEFLGKVVEWIDSGRIEIKVYTGQADYFHAKSYLFASTLDSERGTAIVGSSNFSRAGLQGNTELNVLTQDGFFALHNWYNNLWLSKEAVTDFSPELIKIVKSSGAKRPLQEYQPVKETYYNFANMYGKPYSELDDSQQWVQELFQHQRSGIINIKEKLDSLDTAVLSDGVGLGKTRTAAGVIRLYLASETVHNVLVIADTKLKDQWHDELSAVGVKPTDYSFISRQKLVEIPDEQLKQANYTLVVIDEAHLGFKNNNTKAYHKVAMMKQNNPKMKGLMLTATPWNNQREDVINIGALFLNIDAIPNDRSYKQYFLLSPHLVSNRVVKRLAADDQAFKEFWDDVFLQRTRKTYGGKGVKFPHRNFPSVDIQYEPRKNEIFSDNFDVIDQLKFPYQDPIKYIDDSKEDLGAKQLKMMLLKRADSSWKAYAVSLQHIVDKLQKLQDLYLNQFAQLKGRGLLEHYKAFLGAAYHLTEYQFKNVGIFENLSDFNEDESTTSNQDVKRKVRQKQYLEKITAQIEEIKLPKAKKAIARMTADCERDLTTLKSLINNLNAAYNKIDEKVDKIIQCIDEEHEKGHKVILVSQFADTVEYYYQRLYDHYNTNKITLPMGMITGSANNRDQVNAKLNQNSSTKKDVLEHFSPISKNKPELIKDNVTIDLVIGTDTISTGQNLQDAVTLMNIDLPYNPMTLEQRIGRIDRPLPAGSDKDQIYIYTFPVYESINSQLKMLNRLGNKMAGVLKDTEFDNVVLPQYENYLKNSQNNKQNAVKSMLDQTEDQLMNHSSFSSEKHSEAYQDANKRMYNFKVNQLKPFKHPLIADYSFSSNGQDSSIVVMEVQYQDVNGTPVSKENVLVNADQGKIIGIIDAERSLNHAINNDWHNSQNLPISKAEAKINSIKDGLNQVKKNLVNQYNNQREFFDKNSQSLNNSTAIRAAKQLHDSAVKNQTMVLQKLQSVEVEPSKLQDIIRYVQTIDKDDDLFPIVKEIASNPDVFWMNIKDYIEFFNPDQIKEMEQVGKNIKQSDQRKADLEQTKYRVLTGNLVITNNTK
ncbi:DEAD/DEAH box helicase family protein [Limosilactobacillus reuteri]|uniref:DEAD/DEAH box helicase family protein n=1 Tax=Limosilactobacillus reuteri TaxID=1598 RepID=UPI002AAAC980|nr:DEAD/DEAH box helicase family protein [Limosilactobacillus reuteri]WPU43523.1 phospholipase D-like domain-containing protein [Limosilactobacillus reuteri]